MEDPRATWLPELDEWAAAYTAYSERGPMVSLALTPDFRNVERLGVAIWIWSAALILTKVPRGELITSGPYALVKHPLYTAVALLVVPWVGFLLNSWLGVVIGLVLYIAARMFAPEEEASLARTFGTRWDAYRGTVRLAWL